MLKVIHVHTQIKNVVTNSTYIVVYPASSFSHINCQSILSPVFLNVSSLVILLLTCSLWSCQHFLQSGHPLLLLVCSSRHQIQNTFLAQTLPMTSFLTLSILLPPSILRNTPICVACTLNSCCFDKLHTSHPHRSVGNMVTFVFLVISFLLNHTPFIPPTILAAFPILEDSVAILIGQVI